MELIHEGLGLHSGSQEPIQEQPDAGIREGKESRLGATAGTGLTFSKLSA